MCRRGERGKLIYTLNPVTELSGAKTGRGGCVRYLLYMRRLKSWKSMSLFLSKNPSTEYLQQTQREEVRGVSSKWPDVSTDEHQGVKLSVRKRVNESKLQARQKWTQFEPSLKGSLSFPARQTPASAPKRFTVLQARGLEQTVTPLRRFTN